MMKTVEILHETGDWTKNRRYRVCIDGIFPDDRTVHFARRNRIDFLIIKYTMTKENK
jgi:hypothetical protein